MTALLRLIGAAALVLFALGPQCATAVTPPETSLQPEPGDEEDCELLPATVMINGVDESVTSTMVPDTVVPNTAVTQPPYCIGGKRQTWQEADGDHDVTYSLRFTLRRHQEMGNKRLPLIIYAHPFGQTDTINDDSAQ